MILFYVYVKFLRRCNYARNRRNDHFAMKSFSPAVARRSSYLTRGKNGRDGGAINNPFPYARLCHQVTLVRDITFSQLPRLFFSPSLPPFLPPSGFDHARFHFTTATKTIRQKKRGGRTERSIRLSEWRVRLYRVAFITSGSRVHESCGGDAGAFVGGGKKKNTGVWVRVRRRQEGNGHGRESRVR